MQSAPERFTADKVYTGVSNTHNIWIDGDTAYAVSGIHSGLFVLKPRLR